MTFYTVLTVAVSYEVNNEDDRQAGLPHHTTLTRGLPGDVLRLIHSNLQCSQLSMLQI